MTGVGIPVTPHGVPLLLREGEVHVWTTPLSRAPDGAQEGHLHLASCLSADERDRAQQLNVGSARYVQTRGVLRHILSGYVSEEPSEIRFSYGPNGKPRLANRAVGFNVAHTDGLALIALAQTHDLGVDVERVRDTLDVHSLARHVCTTDERSELDRLAPDARTRAFLACWTRKEALVKAWGDGLSHPLNSFRVEIGPVARPAFLYDLLDPERATRWSLYNLGLGEAYAGALALPGRGWRILSKTCSMVDGRLCNSVEG